MLKIILKVILGASESIQTCTMTLQVPKKKKKAHQSPHNKKLEILQGS